MYGELQAVAEWLALHVIRSKPKKNVSYHLQIGIGACKQVQFIMIFLLRKKWWKSQTS